MRGVYLNKLIEEERWVDITNLDPDIVVGLLGLENTLRLASSLSVDFVDTDSSREYSVRLMYGLKESHPDWKNSWQNESMLMDLCVLARKYREAYFAGQRACALISPIPTELAFQIGTACGGPCPIITDLDRCKLLEGVLKELPYTNALRALKFIYLKMPEKSDRLQQILEMLDRSDEETEDPISIYDCIAEPFLFEAPTSTYFIPLESITPKELFERCRLQNWSSLLLLDPRFIVKCLSFGDVLRLAYRLVGANLDCQKYSVRLLYALRDNNFGTWAKSWRNDVFLGYCCEVSGKYDEQFGFYDDASLNARVVNDDRPFSDVRAVPAGLMIALARCAFLPDPSVTFEQAIGWLEEALKQENYIDALELLLRIYRTTDQPSKASEVECSLETARSHGVYSELPLPPCVHEEFDEPLISGQ